jgi:diadenosine tetraphosphate (Ap4A) HIT family hydrolase
MHPHFHIIPRKHADGLLKHPTSSKSMLLKEQADLVLEALKQHI